MSISKFFWKSVPAKLSICEFHSSYINYKIPMWNEDDNSSIRNNSMGNGSQNDQVVLHTTLKFVYNQHERCIDFSIHLFYTEIEG